MRRRFQHLRRQHLPSDFENDTLATGLATGLLLQSWPPASAAHRQSYLDSLVTLAALREHAPNYVAHHDYSQSSLDVDQYGRTAVQSPSEFPGGR